MYMSDHKLVFSFKFQKAHNVSVDAAIDIFVVPIRK